jgi:hypothetical protein
MYRHGRSGTPEYKAWKSMRQRCLRESDPAYPRYGGRGITICARWGDFAAFLADMGPRTEGGTLDRIDNNGNYEPGNCRWTSMKTQARNRRSNRLLTIDGETLCVSAWAERSGTDKGRIVQRIDLQGWTPREAVFGR